MKTYLEWITAVRDIGLARLTEEERAKCLSVKLLYGAGHKAGLRGVTFFDRWKCNAGECGHTAQPQETTRADVVEVCAFAQESFWQIAGTTLHEFGHVLAGKGTGHDKAWKDACSKLGLRRVKAAGTHYMPAIFAPDVRDAIARLPFPTEGRPAVPEGFTGATGGACSHGQGSRGGTSHGKGSGRMRKYTCACTPPVIVRHAKDTLACTCDVCGTSFKLDEPIEPVAAAPIDPMGIGALFAMLGGA